MIIKNEKSEIENYLVDSANYHGYCDAVYFPENESDIIQIFKSANQNKQKVTVAGNGTGLTGARVPEGGIVIATDKLNKIIDINKDKKYAIVQPGVVLKDFQDLVKSHNLFYPPDPTEQDCFIGATVATNASGAKTFKYGSTRNYVVSLRLVLPDGDTISLKRGNVFADGKELTIITESGITKTIVLLQYKMPNTKNSAGYFFHENMDAIDLFIGSEGTLGIITEIKLRLLNAPENILSGILFFGNEKEALDFTDETRKTSIQSKQNNLSNDINARGIEFFDKGSLQFLKEDYPQIPNNIESAIWFEQEIDSENEEVLIEKWIQMAQKFNADIEQSWFASDMSELQKFKDFRHTVSAKVTEFISSKGIRKVGTDTAVPIENFRKYYEEMKGIVNNAKLQYICYGHIGNCHLHLNMLPNDDVEFQMAKEVYVQLCKRAVELDGTVSAEHGIGKLKRDYLLNMYGEENIVQMAKIKKNIDPNLILGIGNIFDPKYLGL